MLLVRIRYFLVRAVWDEWDFSISSEIIHCDGERQTQILGVAIERL